MVDFGEGLVKAVRRRESCCGRECVVAKEIVSVWKTEREAQRAEGCKRFALGMYILETGWVSREAPAIDTNPRRVPLVGRMARLMRGGAQGG